MKKFKRLFSFFLALVMMLGTVITPSPSFANERVDEDLEASYSLMNYNGRVYKAYKYDDLIVKEKFNSDNGFSFFSFGDKIPDYEKYPVDVIWTAYDLKPSDIKEIGGSDYQLKFQIFDAESRKVIAETDEITSRGKYYFKQTENYDTAITYDTRKWVLLTPDKYSLDVRLITGKEGRFSEGNMTALISQKANSVYRAEYFTDGTTFDVKAKRQDKYDERIEVPLNNTNLDANEYYSFGVNSGNKYYINAEEIKITKFGTDNDDYLRISDKGTAEANKMFVVNPDTNEDEQLGKFTKNEKTYHFLVTGDYKNPYILTFRQELKVNFDPNGGTWTGAETGQEEAKSFAIGHSMKIGESWGDIASISVPTEDEIKPPVINGRNNDFLGWNTDENATVALSSEDIANIEVKEDTTLYAIYELQALGSAKIEYLDLEGKPIDSKYEIGEENYPNKKEGNIGDPIDLTGLKTPQFVGYEYQNAVINPTDGTYTKEGTNSIQLYYKKLKDVIPSKEIAEKPAGYVTVKFDLDNKGTTSDETKYYVNPKVEGLTGIVAPTVKANTGYEFTGWDTEVQTSYIADTTYTAKYTKLKDVISKTDPDTGKENEKPERYVTVTFNLDGKGEATGEAVFYVNPTVEVDLTADAPKVTGIDPYNFVKWDKELNAIFDKETTIYARYSTKIETVPGLTVTPNEQTVQEGAKIAEVVITSEDSKAIIKVNGLPEELTYDDANKKITGTPVINDWKIGETERTLTIPVVVTNENGSIVTKTATVKVTRAENVVPQTEEQKPTVPASYVKVEFKQGERGTIATDATTIYWVKPNTLVEVPAPSVTAKANYKHNGWTYKLNDEEKNSTETTSVKDTFNANTTVIATYMKTTCMNPDALKAQFEKAANAKFENIGSMKDVFAGKYDAKVHKVTVAIMDKEKSFTSLSGTGLVAGLTDLFENNSLVKFKIGDEEERDLNAIWDASGKDKKKFQQNVAQIVGMDMANALKLENISKLSDFVDEQVNLKLTVQEPDCDNASSIDYRVEGKEAISSLLKDKLEAQDIAVWVKDGITWKDGVKLVDSANDVDKTNFSKITEVKDSTDPARTSETAGKYTGNLFVKFEDGSYTTVNDQALYVYEEKGDYPTDESQTVPKDGFKVVFKIGEGIKSFDDNTTTDKYKLVKSGTMLDNADFPTVKKKDNITSEVTWTGNGTNQGHVVYESNSIFTASATASEPIIEITDPANTETPAGYVRVTFTNGTGVASVTGITTYDVKADGSVRYSNLIDKVEADGSNTKIALAENYRKPYIYTIDGATIEGNSYPSSETTIAVGATSVDKITYEPTAQVQTAKVGDTVEAKNSIANKFTDDVNTSKLPDKTEFEFSDVDGKTTDAEGKPIVVDTSKFGDKTAYIKVTYPDGTSEVVQTTIKVVPKEEILDITDPENIDIPEGYIRINFAEDNSITYTTESPVAVDVKIDSTVRMGDVINRVTVNPKADYKAPISWYLGAVSETSTPVDQLKEVKNFVDNETVALTLTPKATLNDNKVYVPEGQEQTVVQGADASKVLAKDSIANIADMPAGTEYKFVDDQGNDATVDTSKIGSQDVKIQVTFPDRSTTTIDTKINIIPKDDIIKQEPDQDGKYPNTPAGYVRVTLVNDETSVNKFKEVYDVKLKEDNAYILGDILNRVATLQPNDGFRTPIIWKNGNAEVDTKDEIKEETTLTAYATQKYSGIYTPQIQDQNVVQGDTPKAEDSIANKFTDDITNKLPEGTKFDFVDANGTSTTIDTNTAGNKTAYVKVTYPDGSSEVVGPVTIIVTEKPKDVIEVTDPITNPTPQEGYARVTLTKDNTVKFEDAKATIYDVRIDANKKYSDIYSLVNAEVLSDAYKDLKWYKVEDEAETLVSGDETISKNLTLKAKAVLAKDIIEVQNPGSTNTPEGYVRVTFAKGDGLNDLTGILAYDVNPNGNVRFNDILAKVSTEDDAKTKATLENGYESPLIFKNGDINVVGNNTIIAPSNITVSATAVTLVPEYSLIVKQLADDKVTDLPTDYTVTLKKDSTVITAEDAKAKAGDEITVDVEVPTGYTLDYIKTTDINGKEIATITTSKEFLMPDKAVNVVVNITKDVQTPETHSLKVNVQDEEGNSITGATITVTKDGIKVNDLTKLENGTYTVTASKNGYEDATSSVTINDSDAEVTLTLKKKTQESSAVPVINPVREGDNEIKIDVPDTAGDSSMKVTATTASGAKIGLNAIKQSYGSYRVNVGAGTDYTPKSGDTLVATFTEDEKTSTDSKEFTVLENIPTGEPSVDYPTVDIKKGESKDIIPNITDRDGKTVDPTDVTITKNPGNGITVEAKKDGTVTVTIPDDYDGPSTVKINVKVTVDGEVIDKTITVNIKDNAKPPVSDESKRPIVNPIEPGDTEITGKGEPGATIEITLPSGDIVRTPVGSGGRWSYDLDEPARSGDDYYVTQIESGKKPSVEVEVEVEERTHHHDNDNDNDNDNTIHIHWGDRFESKFEPKPVEEVKREVIDGRHYSYLNGYPDGTVQPDGFITRAESAKIMATLKGLDMTDNSKPEFKDVESHWYNASINAVVKAGIMKGYPDGTFKPNERITRAEFAQMIMSIDKSNSATAPFADVKGHWAEAAINRAYGNGRINGYPDGSFRPDATITRAEAVKIANSLFDRNVDGDGLVIKLENPSSVSNYIDLSKNHWAYYEIVEASNTHDYQRRVKGEAIENWVEVK